VWEKTMETIQEAAVLVPVYQEQDDDHWLILVRRTETGVHGGQLAFPGGKRDRSDRSLLDTALREAEEEIGISPRDVKILDRLPEVRITTTGFLITPFLASVLKQQKWSPQEEEIAEILEVRVRDLTRPEVHGVDFMRVPGWKSPRKIQFYKVGPHRLWGATYRILKPLIPRLLSGECKI
jgi:8-oxo-dGTP pyrophosphatase MutT (NUDIX family)